METLLVVILIVLLIRWLMLSARLGSIETNVARFEEELSNRQVATLVARVYKLEQRVAEWERGAVAPQAPAPQPEPPVIRIKPVVEAKVPPPAAPEPPPVAPPLPPRPPVVSPIMTEAPPAPSWSEQLRSRFGDEEWEALLGGSLLNKAGALVLVIAIALFLSYSFAYMSAVGRAATALTVSTAILGAGIWFETKARYRIFARGLIGAGWAGLYATAYALYALPATRIIEDPFVGSIGLLLVAAGMIAHSLLYRVQAVTAVAYFTAFAALAVTPSTPFAVMSLIPLAASVLYLAGRLEWHGIALFGLFATYGTCIYHGSSDAPLVAVQSLFLAYWLLFEAFDLLRTRKRLTAGGLEWIFPLNSAGFLGLSYFAWSHRAPEQLWLASAYGAALFFATALARAFLRPPSSFPEEDDFLDRLRAGSYEGALVISAVLAGLAVVGRVTGVWTSVGLAVEAEILYLAGVRFRAAFLRGLGNVAFAFSLGSLTIRSADEGKTPVLGHPIWDATPPALFHAFLFYGNRALNRSGIVFSSLAAALVTAVLAAEAPERFIGTAFLAFAAILFEFGVRKRLLEFRVQAYTIASAGIVAAAFLHASGTARPWLSLAVSLAIAYALELRSRWYPADALGSLERTALAQCSSLATALLAALLLWRTVPEPYLGLAWCGLALTLFELGNHSLPAELRLASWPMAAVAAGGVIVTHAGDFAKFGPPSLWLSYFGVALAATAASVRVIVRPPANADSRERGITRDLMAVVALAATMTGLWIVLPDPLVSPAWALLGLGAVELGFVPALASLGSLGHAAMAVTLLRVFGFDMSESGKWHWISGRIWAVAPVIAALYRVCYRVTVRASAIIRHRLYLWAAAIAALPLIAAEAHEHGAAPAWMLFALLLLGAGIWRNARDLLVQGFVVAALAFAAALMFDVAPPQVLLCSLTAAGLYAAQLATSRFRPSDSQLAGFLSVMATVLLTVLLYFRVSGELLTVAWGLEGLGLLAAGFALRERPLRLEGLILFFACILKLFLYDLRNLETLYRILSFGALGLIMLSVSWVYTRFREHIRRLL